MNNDKKSIKRYILDKFRSMDDDNENFVLPVNRLFNEYVEKLDSYDSQMVLTAAKELASVGLLEMLKGPAPELRLTQKGANLIF
ncbi:MAG: hypothetical protein JRI88_04195 [Deltaproteobacteria bacterium]|nr:hypothetical protein [Deltaproteobacteria bacterium]